MYIWIMVQNFWSGKFQFRIGIWKKILQTFLGSIAVLENRCPHKFILSLTDPTFFSKTEMPFLKYYLTLLFYYNGNNYHVIKLVDWLKLDIVINS